MRVAVREGLILLILLLILLALLLVLLLVWLRARRLLLLLLLRVLRALCGELLAQPPVLQRDALEIRDEVQATVFAS